MDTLESSWDLMFKLDQLVEYYLRNVFIENYAQNVYSNRKSTMNTLRYIN